jgi:hypothetical protein
MSRAQGTESGVEEQHGRGWRGQVNRLLASRVEQLIALAGAPLYKKYLHSSRHVAATQKAMLQDILNQARDTAFGRDHGLRNVRDIQSFRQAVPVGDYEDHRPYVERHQRGEENVLFPGKPMMYAQTSGTTDKAKLIPISHQNFEKTIKNRGKLWLYGLSRNFPGVYSGKDFTIVSPAVEGQVEDGTPLGSMSGMSYQNIPPFLKAIHTIPYEVMTVDDYETKSYLLLRFGLPSDVSLILTANPASIHNLVRRANRWQEELIRDIHDGTLKADLVLSRALRTELESRLGPAPNRAAELTQLAQRRGRLEPRDYWPNLRLVHTWKCGNTGRVVEQLRPWFRENQPFLEFGYLSSEICSTDIVDPATDGSLLAVGSAFYEFSPAHQEESKDYLLAHQLEKGEKYNIHVTTLSGLYRYDMNDVLEVVGHFNQVPILRFLYKGKGITNLQGEKLSEQQLMMAVARASEETGVACTFFVGYADADGPGYELFAELPPEVRAPQRRTFAQAVDWHLGQVNVEYQAKRHSKRLKPLRLVSLGPDSFERYQKLRLAEGTKEGQFKWLQLCALPQIRDCMEQLQARRPKKRPRSK